MKSNVINLAIFPNNMILQRILYTSTAHCYSVIRDILADKIIKLQ